MAANGFVIQTKMAAALNSAMQGCIADGRNPGRIGHRILTNNAQGTGVKYRKIVSSKQKGINHKSTAETAA